MGLDLDLVQRVDLTDDLQAHSTCAWVRVCSIWTLMGSSEAHLVTAFDLECSQAVHLTIPARSHTVSTHRAGSDSVLETSLQMHPSRVTAQHATECAHSVPGRTQ
jgi:hypothetical protein